MKVKHIRMKHQVNSIKKCQSHYGTITSDEWLLLGIKIIARASKRKQNKLEVIETEF